MSAVEHSIPTPDVARRVFGDQVDRAEGYADFLIEHGAVRGVIGPREIDRLWERHILNSAVLSELVADGVRVIDVGSGGGFPGVPLAIARPDVEMVLLDPMARRIDWLHDVVDRLDLSNVTVVRGRAEEKSTRKQVGTAEVVTARAVAPLGKLARWCLPLVRRDGELLALKGDSAAAEIERDARQIGSADGVDPVVMRCGEGVLDHPTTVVRIRKGARADQSQGQLRRKRH
ncbi:16S rRNA (guanine(527)-N(7))-methyltransferase RsmG [Haloechinothrix salitolerans]|uniref:Ribosomal RNA small subunit methyltransferase G n=1 Tax=Haloechinothrix salitolerans TaxID=926830 RepID=A0ABW2BSA5_9PSEU